jgi:hypothetical protein
MEHSFHEPKLLVAIFEMLDFLIMLFFGELLLSHIQIKKCKHGKILSEKKNVYEMCHVSPWLLIETLFT